ncbi:MAG TPA: SHOCT domain-containing protein [Thermodesulfovibrionales bacterium]|nr:SHOCT domain-containing protein [Thermodesulfovibrionales bacterium]
MKKVLMALVVMVAFVPSLGYAEESWERSFHWSWGPWGYGAGSCFLIPLILMIAFWIVVIIGIVYFVKWVIATGKGHEIRSEETALDILKKRYAKGEISKEEFERMKRDIL